MPAYEYRVVCPPRRAKRVKGLREPSDKFAQTLTDMINAVAAEGWEYLRADTLPMEEKKSMMGSATESFQTVLVFRRALDLPQRLESGARTPALGPATSD